MSDKPDAGVDSRVKCLLNSSHSKQSYSFSRAQRFKPLKKDNNYVFYNIPDTISRKGTSIGYGKKFDFTSKMKNSQSQTIYCFPSLFDPKNHNAPAYTFGTSRPVNKRSSSSGNGSDKLYDLSIKIGTDAPKFTIRQKTRNKEGQSTTNVPGPGTYFKSEVGNGLMGKYFNSKYKNTAIANIGLKEKRFMNKVKEAAPSPQSYRLPSLINIGGYIYESRFKSNLARSFVGVKILKEKNEVTTPGPGAYKTFSIFDGYDSERQPNVLSENNVKK